MATARLTETDLTGRSVLLIIGGGIAAFKSLELIRMLTARGAAVRVILTRAGAQFVTPLSATVLSGQEALSDLFTPEDEAKIGHIELSRSADLIAVVPATADLMAKMANGIADDLATTVLLATDTPVLLAPAMNVRMWEHPATKRNLAQLKSDGIAFVGPDEGAMACGEFGPGRMSEPSEIAGHVANALKRGAKAASAPGPLSGKHVLVTTGPTHEPIDPVRYLANRSSGKQGDAIARAARDLGARVTLVSGPTQLADPAGIETIRVETAEQMLAETRNALPADIAVFAAAVADWRADVCADQKMKKDAEADASVPDLALVENPDILKTISNGTPRPELVIGFAAETEQVEAHATAKLESKGCDWIVANDVSVGADGTGVMGGDLNRVLLIKKDGSDAWPVMNKDAVAAQLMAEATRTIATRQAAAE